MNASNIYSLWALAAVIVLTTYTEIRNSTIPNWITLPALAFALVTSFLGVGIPLVSSLIGLAVGFGFLFLFYVFGGMGGGDVKLMGAVGALLGFPDILNVLTYTAFIGGAMAVVALIWHKRFWAGIGDALSLLMRRRPQGADHECPPPGTGPVPPKASPITIPYGLAIVAGVLIHIFIGAQGGTP